MHTYIQVQSLLKVTRMAHKNDVMFVNMMTLPCNPSEPLRQALVHIHVSHVKWVQNFCLLQVFNCVIHVGLRRSLLC